MRELTLAPLVLPNVPQDHRGEFGYGDVALHFMPYNFARPRKTLANPYPRTPAMAAGVSAHVWTLTEIAVLVD